MTAKLLHIVLEGVCCVRITLLTLLLPDSLWLEYAWLLPAVLFLILNEHVTFWLHTTHYVWLWTAWRRSVVTDLTSRLESKVLRLLALERLLVGEGLRWFMHCFLGNTVTGMLFGGWSGPGFGFLEKALSLCHLNYWEMKLTLLHRKRHCIKFRFF